jgi:hypothetical protein
MGEDEALEYRTYKELEIFLKIKETYFEMIYAFGLL